MESVRSNSNIADIQFEDEIRAHLNNWCKVSDVPSTDQIIDAFEYGVKVGLENRDKYAKKIFMNNINLAFQLSETYYEWIKSQHVSQLSAYLKVENIDIFETLIVVDADKYFDKEIRADLYRRARELRKENNTSTFNIEFILKPYSKELNSRTLQNHGYFLSYNPKEK
jgi:hypothetical protein